MICLIQFSIKLIQYLRHFKQIEKNCGCFHEDAVHNIKQKNISKYFCNIEN